MTNQNIDIDALVAQVERIVNAEYGGNATVGEIVCLTQRALRPPVAPTNTVRVRVAVVVDPKGNWASSGCKDMDEDEAHDNAIDDDIEHGEARYWLVKDLPIPHGGDIEADVEEVADVE